MPVARLRPGSRVGGSPTSSVAGSQPLSKAAVAVAVAGFVLLGTRQAFTVPYTGLGLSLAQLILLVLVLVWVVSRLFGQRGAVGLGLLTAFLAVRIGCTFVSYGLAASRSLTPDQQSGGDRALVIELAVALLVIVLATVLRTRREIELVLRAIVAGGALSAVFALVQYAGGPDVAGALRPPGFTERESVLVTALLREGLVRPQGAAAHPLELGAVAAMLVPVGIGLVLAARRRGDTAWPWALATAVIAAGGVVSLSRSTFLGIAVGVLVMMPRWPLRRVGTALAAVVAVGLGALIAVPRLANALLEVFTQGSDDYSLQSRADGRAYVWNTFANHFWFGQGPGTYDLNTQQVLDNQYLSQLMETGVLGLLLLAAVTVCAFGYAWRAGTRSGTRSVAGGRGELGSGVAGALAAVLVVSLVIDTGGFVQVFTLIWLLIGLAAALWRLETGGVGSDVTPAAATAR